MTWMNRAFPGKNPFPKLFFDGNENRTVQVLPDDNTGGSSDDSGTNFDEDDFLGQDGGFGEPDVAASTGAPAQQPGIAAPFVQPQAPQQAAPVVAPPTQDPVVSAAFADQRRFYENALAMQQQQLIDLNNRFSQGENRQAPVVQPPAAPPVEPPMPDPVDFPKEFAEWAVNKARNDLRSEVMQELAPVVQQVEGLNRSHARSAYENSLMNASQRYGANWDQLYQAAGAFAKEYPALQAEVINSPDQGEAIARLGARALGIQLPTPGQQQPAPQAQPQGQQGVPQYQAAPQLTEAQIRADERQRATRELMAQLNQNPHNLAVPSVSGMPASPVVTTGGPVRPGSPEEDAILGS